MSGKSILPSYHVPADTSPGAGGRGRHHVHHTKAQHHYSPSRRKKSRWCCFGAAGGSPLRLRHLVVLFFTLLFIFYVTDCLHLYKRISLKKETGITHLQTTTWNFRFSRGPIDFSMGTFQSRDFVDITYNPR
ncbi:hypothetical protein PspLS_01919 [Pyricularia sp. CBS 133598]|nr:hypothetical protein PspLS_01919 [Pyricularia sp. CBS 133598]